MGFVFYYRKSSPNFWFIIWMPAKELIYNNILQFSVVLEPIFKISHLNIPTPEITTLSWCQHSMLSHSKIFTGLFDSWCLDKWCIWANECRTTLKTSLLWPVRSRKGIHLTQHNTESSWRPKIKIVKTLFI